MMVKSRSKPGRSGALDLLRFLAVLAVYFAHYTDTFNLIYQIVPENHKYNFISRYGSVALLVFFMVSGYVVTMTSVKRNLKDFVVSRLSRLYPLFWVSCLAAFILPRIIEAHSYLSFTSVKALLLNLTMVPMIFGYPLMNPVFHTLVIELFFYIFIALIIYFKLWNKLLIVIAGLTLFSLANLFLPAFPVHIIVTPFVAGILFYLISVQYSSARKLYSLLFANFICALFGANHLAIQLQALSKEPNTINVWVITLMVILIYLIFLLISVKKLNIKSNAFFTFLGEIAYPFYLFHIYFLCFYWYFSDKIQADLLLFGILLSAILVSWFLNKFIEKPFNKAFSLVLYTFIDFFNKKKKSQPTEASF
ncbi:acyltransferase family protein [Pedobacter heparinus]|uniref:Acyltransferase 3 n=1 Tax=Pedobacter heparinus (strain ATCC 13125 / DSM 2366 / CIP 104194 / JCM 7457 / NBRC 12017 / NCIMB 9290 / NRRL B-14731 / HIM 762-3) TaxID=485917 RepID=C6XWT4_PEDHD|nr:acyltransferase 3 [Pedobacter heparinus DSM 2366]